MPQRRYVIPLLLVAALVAAALGQGGADGPGAPRRELRASSPASPADCARAIANCGACRQQAYGAVDATVCATCTGSATGAKIGGRSCWCQSGYYAPGGGPPAKAAPAVCVRCPDAPGYDGALTSRPGLAFDPDACFREFPTGAAAMGNELEWDLIQMPEGSLTIRPDAGTLAACQSACAAAPACQYFAYYSYGPASARCRLRLAPAGARAAGDVARPSPGDYYVMLDIRDGSYVAYRALSAEDAKGIGGSATLSTHRTFEEAKAACDRAAICAGFANTGPAAWRAFGGSKWEGAVGKVRVAGDAINAFAPLA